MITGQMPSITPAQIVAVVGWAVAQAVAWGLIDQAREQLAISIGSTVLAAALKLADSYLRAHRALAVAQTPNIVRLPAEQPVAADGSAVAS